MIVDTFPRLKGLILDMDGVLWRENESIGNLPQIFDLIRKLGLSFVMATNNATKSVEEYQQKFLGFGVDIEKSQILSSALVTVSYLRQTLKPGSRIYVVGSPSLRALIQQNDFHVLELDESPTADAVVAALDKDLTYHKLRYATTLIRNGASFIATNGDVTFPTPEGIIPGAGTIVKALETSTSQEALVIGKPQAYIFHKALEIMDTKPEETLAVGDRLDTDILGANNAGLLNALVLSGVTSRDEAIQSSIKIDIIVNNLWELLHA